MYRILFKSFVPGCYLFSVSQQFRVVSPTLCIGSVRHVSALCMTSLQLPQIRSTRLESVRFAGHNKWSNIKRTKAVKDLAKSQLIAIMCRKIKRAIVSSGGQCDPELNSKLEAVLVECRAKNVPKDTIKRQLDRAQNAKYFNEYFEFKGPGGSFFIAEVLTDNANRSKNYFAKLINKSGPFMFTDSGIRNFFDQKGVVSLLRTSEYPLDATKEELATLPPPAPPLDLNDAETLAIEVGAEEVQESTDEEDRPTYELICDPFAGDAIRKELDSRGYTVLDISTRFIPHQTVDLSQEHAKFVYKMFEIMGEYEELSNIFDNLASPAAAGKG